MLRENIQRVLSEYLTAKTNSFAGHPLANFLRHDFPDGLKTMVDDTARYKSDGSAGMGQWANCPWVATFDILVTESAQNGYYPFYLFKEDMRGVYLSLNQGVSMLKEGYKSAARDILQMTATEFRAKIGNVPKKFSHTTIDLAVTSKFDIASLYEAGNIYAVYYPHNKIPSEETLITDYLEMLRIYEALSYRESIPITQSRIDQDDPDTGSTIEDLIKFRMHKRIERRSSLAKKAIQVHGYTCQACGFNFNNRYGEIGKGFIEAHHLKPIAQLKGNIVDLNPQNDFSVLCSNCHSMIHKFEMSEDIVAFKRLLS
ncbi:MrcB family domain-containing protein [Chloroflexota bacterium]